MTAIVGVVSGNTVWLGGDSAVEDTDGEIMLQAMSKVFKRGPCVIGICGFSLWEDLIRSVRVPAECGGKDYDWVRSTFGDPIRGAEFWDDQHGTNGSRGESAALIGYRGRVWSLCGDGSIFPLAGKVAAIGSGGNAAYGALYALRGRGLEPLKMLRIALEAAESRTHNVRRPFRYVHT